ncbi:PREDICTED: uncharacterized protein LOC109214556 [Nicotiana attenuata]|uniref:uncharacterized protein LOC109214556 n=1 Tax=Nicotiana attenuata TaxID=49451 RepID=UPI000905548E|nr:PREDICTED: uncharacterized protein LOC109214556 [Nicotiana attenuata]
MAICSATGSVGRYIWRSFQNPKIPSAGIAPDATLGAGDEKPLLLSPGQEMTNGEEQIEPVVTVTTNIVSGMPGPSRPTAPATAMPPTERPGKFSGVDFKRWQQKMFFYLTTLSLQRFIQEDVPVVPEGTPDNERFLVTEAWKHSDFLCKNYILSGLEDGLYNVYSVMKTSRELWNALEKKYKTEDAGLKKFVAAKFLDFKMIDGKSVITQVQELQVIVHDLLAEGMVINEAFQVAAFIEKLPPLWKDFKNYLKHKRKEMTLEDLIVRLRIEEDNKAAEKKSRGNSTIMGANIVEEASTSKKRKKPSGSTNYPSKKRFKGNCHNCGKELFTSYAPAGPDETVFMANSATAKIEGTGKVALKMTSGKIVTLKDVLHVPEMRKNLVSTSLLVKNGFKCVFVSDKVVISKNEMFLSCQIWYTAAAKDILHNSAPPLLPFAFLSIHASSSFHPSFVL